MRKILTTEKINGRHRDYKKAKYLKEYAFPKYEQMPMWLMRLLTIRKNVEFLAFYDEDVFVGMTYGILSEKISFIMYLAVYDDVRSKGYGSEILKWHKNHAGNRLVTLNIEPLDKKAENYDQRLRRFNFYVRNGFSDTGYTITEFGNDYEVLSTSDEFNAIVYHDTIKRLSYCLFNPGVRKTE